MMSTLFRTQIPEIEKTNFIVTFAQLSAEASPATITQNEFMRRMKEMAAMQPGAAFYGEMPDSYELVVNTAQPAVKKIIELASDALSAEVTPIRSEIETLNKEIEDARKAASDKKEQAPDLSEKESKVADLRKREEDIIRTYAAAQPNVKQIIDLALLQSNLLKGEKLNEFIRRSVSLLS